MYDEGGHRSAFSEARRHIGRAEAPQGSYLARTDQRGHAQYCTIVDFSTIGGRLLCEQLPPIRFDGILVLSGECIACQAQVVGFSEDPSGAFELRCQWSLEDPDAAVRAYLRARFPQVVRKHEHPQAASQLLEESGYLSSFKPDLGLERWAAWPDGPDNRSFLFLDDNNDGVGHISISKWWPTAWSIHQLAGKTGHVDARTARLKLYEAVATVPRLYETTDVSLVGWYNTEEPVHRAFAAGLRSWSIATSTTFNRYRIDDIAPQRSPSLRRVESVGDSFLAAKIASQMCEPEIAKGLGLSPHQLEFELKGTIHRERQAHLWEDDTGVSVVLAEMACREASLFNSANNIQIWGPPNAPVSEIVASLTHVYRDRGRPMILVANSDAPHDFQSLRWEEAMGCTVIHPGALGSFEAYVVQSIAEYEQKKAQQEGSNAV